MAIKHTVTGRIFALILGLGITSAMAEPSDAQVAPEPAADVNPDLRMPEPVEAYGMKNGPCNVSVSCGSGNYISCAGQTICYWKVNPNGFVECDGYRTT